MSPSSVKSSAAGQVLDEVESWWQAYLQHLAKKGIGKKSLPWYRSRVEALPHFYQGTHSRDITAVKVEAYLGTIDGRRWAAWQVDQMVDAVQRFGQAIRVDWRDAVDWLAWRQRCMAASAPDPEGAIPRPVALAVHSPVDRL